MKHILHIREFPRKRTKEKSIILHDISKDKASWALRERRKHSLIPNIRPDDKLPSEFCTSVSTNCPCFSPCPSYRARLVQNNSYKALRNYRVVRRLGGVSLLFDIDYSRSLTTEFMTSHTYDELKGECIYYIHIFIYLRRHLPVVTFS